MKTIKYIGSQARWPELAATGYQSVWMPGQIEERSDGEAATLLATGLFVDVGDASLSADELTALHAIMAAYDQQPATWYNGEINSTVTPTIVADGDLTSATDQVPKWWLIVLNAQDDVEAAQRLLDGGPNVLTVLPGQSIQPPVQDYLGESGVLTTAHVVCISTATAVPADYTGGAYILSDATAETLANALANMARFQWSSGLGCTAFRAVASPVYSTNYSALMVAAGV
ncbi:MAG: hypothetical protein RJA36_3104 [Pseudomonadota bacterium]|jgi:hypothetical protein